MMKKIIASIILGVILIAGSLWYATDVALEKPVSTDQNSIRFTVELGTGSTSIARQLKAAGLIRSLYAFEWYVWRAGIDTKLKPGDYFLSKSMSTIEIAQTLSHGPGEQRERTITIIEGWSDRDIADYFEKQGIASAQEVLDKMQHKQSWWDKHGVLKGRPTNVDLEGYLFPDTYRIFNDATVDEILEKMVANLENKVTLKLREEVVMQEKTLHQILTMASILEREVRKPLDMKMVSDIFWKRIRIGMALQSDATINYITGKGTATPSADDLKIKSPYNTYLNRGLPPGPISNPGINAIESAIYPTPNPYYFYLTTLDTGMVIYAKDHDQHVANKQKYLK